MNGTPFKTVTHQVDFCVVGGGLAGMFAAISAARNGAKVAIMQDRPVFGGNASSEIRMWVGGASGEKYYRETGLLEEISLDNLYRNPNKIYGIWDSILYEKIRFEENITMLLNCSCQELEMDGDNRIKSITGWQLTTQTYHTVQAQLFADCSGDSVLAPLSGAEHRWGRESKDEFGESLAVDVADRKTMGNSCLIQAREYPEKRPYTPPVWANKYTKETLMHRIPNMKSNNENFWYMEIGGTRNTIEDAEEIRDDLLKIAFGIWDYVKNSGDMDADNWDLDWVGFLPGKRENRRYVGDHILTQVDVQSEGKFDDVVAYGGWKMDDHPPEAIEFKGHATVFHNTPCPYGIPYRSLYSKNIENLLFAGRNISATHMAMSSSRVMSTCAVIGQAMGTAAALAVSNNTTPRGVYEKHIRELRSKLMDDDCYLPFAKREVGLICRNAEILSNNTENAEAIVNGIDRDTPEAINAAMVKKGGFVGFAFEKPVQLSEARIVFNSDLSRSSCSNDFTAKKFAMGCNIPLNKPAVGLPPTLVKDFSIEVKDENGNWRTTVVVSDNHQRLVKVPLQGMASAVRLVINGTYGDEQVLVYAFEVR